MRNKLQPLLQPTLSLPAVQDLDCFSLEQIELACQEATDTGIIERMSRMKTFVVVSGAAATGKTHLLRAWMKTQLKMDAGTLFFPVDLISKEAFAFNEIPEVPVYGRTQAAAIFDRVCNLVEQRQSAPKQSFSAAWLLLSNFRFGQLGDRTGDAPKLVSLLTQILSNGQSVNVNVLIETQEQPGLILPAILNSRFGVRLPTNLVVLERDSKQQFARLEQALAVLPLGDQDRATIADCKGLAARGERTLVFSRLWCFHCLTNQPILGLSLRST